MKKVPERMCLACRTMQPKRDLIRVVRTPEGEVTVDLTGKANGRGAYICKTQVCLQKAKKSNAFARQFHETVSDEIYNKLSEIIETNK